MSTIDFNKVIAYSQTMCYDTSHSKCATFVKKAFERGGCKYIDGDGWNNQKWCEKNNFVCIGDFVPLDKNPRAHDGMSMQFPPGYKQQIGDVCLLKHGIYGHICYAMGPGINDWVSDYFQRPPAQQAGTGPYCYTGGIERVQFWRHKSVLGRTPSVQEATGAVYADATVTNNRETTTSQFSGVSNNVEMLAYVARRNENVLKQDDARKKEFESLVSAMTNDAPKMGRDILISADMLDANILKGSQESRKERV